MLYLYYIHLSIIKKIYTRTNWKDKNSYVKSLSFFSLFILFLFVFTVFDIYILETIFLLDVLGKGYPLVLIGGGLTFIITMIISFFSSKKLSSYRITTIRKAIAETANIRSEFGGLYIAIYVCIFFIKIKIILTHL